MAPALGGAPKWSGVIPQPPGFVRPTSERNHDSTTEARFCKLLLMTGKRCPPRPNGDPQDPSATGRRPSALTIGLALLAVGVVLFLVWETSSTLLLVFAAILFAAFLDAAARAVSIVLPVGRGWGLAMVVSLLAVIVGIGVVWGAAKLPEQTRLLLSVMDSQLDVLQHYLVDYGIELLGPDRGRDFTQWLMSDQGRLFGHARIVLGGASSFLTGALVVVFLGLLLAFDPHSHRDSIVLLVSPSYRPRARAVMDEMGEVLRFWFVGLVIRVVLMTVVVASTLHALGLPGYFVLGLQAGVSNFIPYLGPIAAAVPIALVAMPLGGSTLVWTVFIYTIIQSVEGYVIGPLIQRQAVAIPPAWTLAAIVLLGSLFGVLGIALAMPLVAVGRILILRSYVEDFLGEKP